MRLLLYVKIIYLVKKKSSKIVNLLCFGAVIF
jgi:hypothetical protein